VEFLTAILILSSKTEDRLKGRMKCPSSQCPSSSNMEQCDRILFIGCTPEQLV